MLYEFLAGELPFKGETPDKLREQIFKKKLKFGSGMVDASHLALTFVERLLVKNPENRCSPSQALADRWIVTTAPTLGEVALSKGIIKKVQNFRRLGNLQQIVLHVLTSMLPDFEIDLPRRFFVHVDSDGDGMISMGELRNALGEDDSWSTSKGDQSDLTFAEFLAATLDLQKYLESKLFRDIFSSFDKNSDGTLSLSELSTGCEIGVLSVDDLVDEMEHIDTDGDLSLDFTEFYKMMQLGLRKQSLSM